jgi:hypothetical protein
LSISPNYQRAELARFANRYLLVKTLVASFAVVLALACGGASAAFAQAPNTNRKPCLEMGGDRSKTLSQKLDQGGGVICPPDVDPAIKAPTPDAGKTPVIPPPGSPGGDPKVQPK